MFGNPPNIPPEPKNKAPGTVADTPMVTAALSYIKLGWEVFPAVYGKKKSHKSAKHSNGAAWGKTLGPTQIRSDFNKWPNANIGIATGEVSGIFVIDIDTLEGHGIDGFESWRQVRLKHEPLPLTLMSQSPSGSMHIYFKYPAGTVIPNSTSNIGPGIDVRGKGGIIIAPPSVADKGTYQWLNDYQVADVPGWILDHVIKPIRPAHAAPAKANSADVAVLCADVYRVDPDAPREVWCNVIMAIHHATGGSDAGLNFAETYSKSGDKEYIDADTTVKILWNSLKAPTVDPVTMASIPYLAEKKLNPRYAAIAFGDAVPVLPPGASLTLMSQTLLEDFLHRYVFIEDGNMVCNLNRSSHHAVSKLEEFRNATGNVTHEVPAPTKSEPDRTRIKPVHIEWIGDARRKSARGLIYNPQKEFYFQDNGLYWINDYSAPDFAMPSASADTSFFYAHMDYLLPVAEEREWIIDWVAFNVQLPWRRCKVTPLHICTKHGVGRGWLVELIFKLLGPWNCRKTKRTLCVARALVAAFRVISTNPFFVQSKRSVRLAAGMRFQIEHATF